MLYDFLQENKLEILSTAANKSLVLAGVRPTAEQLEAGLPIFFTQLSKIVTLKELSPSSKTSIANDSASVEKSPASNTHEVEIALTSALSNDLEHAQSAGIIWLELLRLGYTLSHVVHAYGSLCQVIRTLAIKKNLTLSSGEFPDLINKCLDVAISRAVTEYQTLRDKQVREAEVQRCGFCAHELRNALGTASIAFQLIKSGVVSISGTTGQILEKNLLLLEKIIGHSLNEVKSGHSNITVSVQSVNLLLAVDQILLTAVTEAKARDQHLDLQIAPTLFVEADPQLLHSAISNLIQNAIKYSHKGTRIQIRGKVVGENVLIEVEDECGGLAPNAEVDLFKPFEQQNKNRQGLGLGLNIARKAIELHSGTFKALNLPDKGCIFTITLPKRL